MSQRLEFNLHLFTRNDTVSDPARAATAAPALPLVARLFLPASRRGRARMADRHAAPATGRVTDTRQSAGGYPAIATATVQEPAGRRSSAMNSAPRAMMGSPCARNPGGRIRRPVEAFDNAARAMQSAGSRAVTPTVPRRARGMALTEPPPQEVVRTPFAQRPALRLRLRVDDSAVSRDGAESLAHLASVPIVWRQAHGSRSAEDDRLPFAVPAQGLRRDLPFNAPAAHETARFAPPRDVPAPPAASSRMDAATVERLTDDIVRRIERRVRIERERRGL